MEKTLLVMLLLLLQNNVGRVSTQVWEDSRYPLASYQSVPHRKTVHVHYCVIHSNAGALKGNGSARMPVVAVTH